MSTGDVWEVSRDGLVGRVGEGEGCWGKWGGRREEKEGRENEGGWRLS